MLHLSSVDIREEVVTQRDHGLDGLVELNGVSYFLDARYWVKFEAYTVAPTAQIPHGIRYALTLHDHHNQRLLGFDNAHAPALRRKGYHGRIVTWDHKHPDRGSTTEPYAFQNAGQLISDFWKAVDDYLNHHGGHK